MAHAREHRSSLRAPGAHTTAIDNLVQQAWALCMSDPAQSAALAEQALAASRRGRFAGRPYTRGLAGGLVALAFVETYANKLEAAVSKCLEALVLLENEPPSVTLINAWYTLSWNSFFLGDVPGAMENGLKALNTAQELGLHVERAWALDVIASIHGTSQEFQPALEAHHASLRIFREHACIPGEIRALNNLAFTLYLIGDYPLALQHAQHGLELALQAGYHADVVNLHLTIAQILIDVGDLREAERYLRVALDGVTSHRMSIEVIEVFILLEWARLRKFQHDIAGTEAFLLQALAKAEALHRPAELASTHQALAELYEEQRRYADALAHHKAFHEFHMTVVERRTSARLLVLKTIYQVEAARRETEIYRLQASQLQIEVAEQRRMQKILEAHSREDSLTGIANRRSFDETLEHEFTRLARYSGDLSVVLIDLDYFKSYNDTHGHLEGDQCLRRVAQAIKDVARRPSDLAARYGGEEFACILPDTNAAGALVIADMVRHAILKLALPHRASPIAAVVTASIGVATVRCVPGQSALQVVASADAQLYVAKSAGRNCIADMLHHAGRHDGASGTMLR